MLLPPNIDRRFPLLRLYRYIDLYTVSPQPFSAACLRCRLYCLLVIPDKVVEVCQWLHRLGIVWGDVKPENFVEGQVITPKVWRFCCLLLSTRGRDCTHNPLLSVNGKKVGSCGDCFGKNTKYSTLARVGFRSILMSSPIKGKATDLEWVDVFL